MELTRCRLLYWLYKSPMTAPPQGVPSFADMRSGGQGTMKTMTSLAAFARVSVCRNVLNPKLVHGVLDAPADNACNRAHRVEPFEHGLLLGRR